MMINSCTRQAGETCRKPTARSLTTSTIAALTAVFVLFAEPAVAQGSEAAVQGTQITVSSVKGADFATLAQNKVLLVVSPDFSTMAIKLFYKRNIPNSLIVVAKDMPSKKAMIYIDGQLFHFKDLGIDGKIVDVFESKEISTVLYHLKKRMQERP